MRESTRPSAKARNGADAIRRRLAAAKRARAAEKSPVVLPTDPPFLKAALKLAKPRAHLPENYALNHGHYRRGEPKK